MGEIAHREALQITATTTIRLFVFFVHRLEGAYIREIIKKWRFFYNMVQFYKKDSTSSEEIEEKRYRNFMLLLYPEWGSYKDLLQDIKGSFKNYAYIKHIPEEEEKKEHVHLILSLDNPRTEKSLAKRLEIDPRFVNHIKSLRGSCRYLVHADNEDKYQYDLTQVIVSNSFKNTYFKSFDDLLSEEEILDNIYGFIKDYKSMDPIHLEIELTKYVCANGFERVFKRYYNTISKAIIFYSRQD